jgi:DNA recombination protein RmuC
MVEFIIGFAVGAAIGAAIAVAVFLVRAKAGERQMRDAFAALAGEALDANSKRLAEQSAAMLDGKKQLIDQSVASANERMEQIRQFIQRSESRRMEEFGRLSSSVSTLATTTGELHKMLASTQRRGAWGERMAEDVLRLIGMQEGVNYTKQSSDQAESGRPDFTFSLPNDLKANMDVKFPLEHYKAYLDAPDEQARQANLKQLVTAVRGHIRAVAGRGYIDPKVPTVPYVIVFIPSEQIYSLVLETDADVIDDALAQKVVLASPLTLYAMLAVVRQAAENANVMRAAGQVMTLLEQFRQQWQKYNEELDRLGQRIQSVASQYETVRTTRSNMLQRPLDKIEEIRGSRELPETGEDER